jgi:hypothetical protein
MVPGVTGSSVPEATAAVRTRSRLVIADTQPRDGKPERASDADPGRSGTDTPPTRTHREEDADENLGTARQERADSERHSGSPDRRSAGARDGREDRSHRDAEHAGEPRLLGHADESGALQSGDGRQAIREATPGASSKDESTGRHHGQRAGDDAAGSEQGTDRPAPLDDRRASEGSGGDRPHGLVAGSDPAADASAPQGDGD